MEIEKKESDGVLEVSFLPTTQFRLPRLTDELGKLQETFGSLGEQKTLSHFFVWGDY